MYKKGGCEFIYLQSKNFVSAPKIFVGEHFSLAVISGMQRFFCLWWLGHDFSLDINLSHRTRMFRRGTLMCFRKLRYQKVLRGRRREGVS